jgi:hypothetical protein
MGSEVALVDDQEIGPGDGGSSSLTPRERTCLN